MGFCIAYQLSGDEKYLDFARELVDYLIAHGWDAANGGWYDSLTGVKLNGRLWLGFDAGERSVSLPDAKDARLEVTLEGTSPAEVRRPVSSGR